MIHSILIAGIAGLLAGLAPHATPPAGKLVIYRGAELIDGTGAGVRSDMAIVVEGSLIRAVLPSRELKAADLTGAEVVELRGLHVLPGLIDSHVHLATYPNRRRSEAMMRRDIYGGVTAVRDMAGDERALADLARSSLIGDIPGPDIYYSALMAGPAFFKDPRPQSAARGVTAGDVPWLQAITDQTDLPLAVAAARGTSASGVKIYSDVSGPLMSRVAAEAHRQGLQVWAHGILFPATPGEVVAAGPDVVSHACQLAFQASEPPPTSISPAPALDQARLADPDNARMAALFREMRRRGVILDATNYVYVQNAREREAAGKRVACSAETSARVTAQAYREGVAISAGTDAFSPTEDPFPALHEEMLFLSEEAGMPAAEVIRSATLVGAMTIGQQARMGTVEPGKLANLLVLSGNPLDDLKQLRSIVFTVKRGVRFPRAEYRPITPDEVVDDED